MEGIKIERITLIIVEVVEAAERLTKLLESSNQVVLSLEYLRRMVSNPDHHWLMARRLSDGKLVGMASLYIMPLPTNARSFLENVAVDESAQGQGVGEALCRKAIEIADSQGVNTLRTAAGKNNAASQAMLKKVGFVKEVFLDNFEFDIHDGPRTPRGTWY